jgi:hypothetical protein
LTRKIQELDKEILKLRKEKDDECDKREKEKDKYEK